MVEINGKPMGSYPKDAQAAIKAQPGYDGKGEYCISRSVAGQTRLYKMVDSRWMDASLDDAPALAPYAPVTDSARALRAIPSKTRSEQSRINGRRSAEDGKKGGRPKGKKE